MPRQRTEVRIAFGATAEADFPGGTGYVVRRERFDEQTVSRGGADAGRDRL